MSALLLVAMLLAVHSHALDVQVPDSPVVALYGSDTILNCTFSGVGTFNQSAVSVFWQRADSQRLVHGYLNSQDQLVDQEERFTNRTSMFPGHIATGNVSLLLRGVRVADEGIYSCFVRVDSYGKNSVVMQVAAPYSKPSLVWEADANPKPGVVAALTCTAFGGYPEAQVLWQNEGGQNLTENVTFSLVANDQGLFTVRSVLTVALEPSSTYSCSVSNPLLGEDGHASITISAQGLVFPQVALWVTIGLAVCLLGLLIALAVVCHRKIKESCEELRAEEEAKELEAKVLEEAKDPEESKTAATPLKS